MARNGQNDRAGDDESCTGEEEGRQRLDGDADAEVGGTPDEIERDEGGEDAARRGGDVGPRHATVGSPWVAT